MKPTAHGILTRAMRLYYTGASPRNLARARLHAPSHSHGAGWTPQKMTNHDVPYFLDNGAYSGKFNQDEWLAALDQAMHEMDRWPDFFVWPDVYGDAEATWERNQHFHLKGSTRKPWRGDLNRYWAFQPGLPLEEQFDNAYQFRFDGVFVGGPQDWKREHAATIVQMAHEKDKRVHIGNPGGVDGLVWAFQIGADSVDTTSIFQNGYWHYLDRLEAVTDESLKPIWETRTVTLDTYE